MKIPLSACFKIVSQGCAKAIGRISGFSKQGQPTNPRAKDSKRTMCLLSPHMAHLGLGHPFFKKNLFIYLFYFWLHWVFVAACGLSLVAARTGYSSLQCASFSLRWLLLESTGSRLAGFSSCDTRAQ